MSDFVQTNLCKLCIGSSQIDPPKNNLTEIVQYCAIVDLVQTSGINFKRIASPIGQQVQHGFSNSNENNSRPKMFRWGSQKRKTMAPRNSMYARQPKKSCLEKVGPNHKGRKYDGWQTLTHTHTQVFRENRSVSL